MPRYSHVVVGPAETERYTATRSRGRDFNLPNRDRASHAAHLIGSLESIQRGYTQGRVQVGNGFYETEGLTLTFESDPMFPLAFESLDLQRSKIQLLSVKEDAEGRTLASLFVPNDKVDVLLGKLEKYRDFIPGETRGRENKTLAESIANIKLATLQELWTDDASRYPAANTSIVWEVWLRPSKNPEQTSLELFSSAASDFGYEIISSPLDFVDRTVVLVRGTREALSRNSKLLGLIAEVRKAKATADFYSVLSPSDQRAVTEEFLSRIAVAGPNAPVVALLDTGVNRGHPALAPVIADADLHALKAQWGVHDTHHNGHGTQMAGLALYGDLAPILAESEPIALRHGLQSLKLIHARDPHAPELYGIVTIEGIARLETTSNRHRTYCMAITADASDRGRPSSWSAALDNLACGAINDTRRLILVSAGNTELQNRADYPAHNETESVQDPAQAWNVLTVGGFTEKVFVNEEERPGWQTLAAHGDLAPSSTTSMTWPRSAKAPYKPDIVMEAGNMGLPPDGSGPDFLEELQLLTTNVQFAGDHRPLISFHDTSAATALAAKLVTELSAQYPAFTPETLRGFMIHSARWTPSMLSRATDSSGRADVTRLLRTFGYGTPDRDALFYSAGNQLTLIAQESIQPFFDDNGTVKTRDIKFHTLPWPRDVLLSLPLQTEVELRVTLSYFIEPSPGERGWDRKYGYPSHGLRFQVIRPTESLAQFKLRINAYDRDEGYDEDHAGESGHWTITGGTPNAGSIHSNIWTGTAAQLAERSHIAVHPTLGWWRTRRSEGRYNNSSYYSLIVTLRTPSEQTDIYTPVANQIGIANPIEI